MAKRCALRRYLEAAHGCTLVPGGTLSLADPDSFLHLGSGEPVLPLHPGHLRDPRRHRVDAHQPGDRRPGGTATRLPGPAARSVDVPHSHRGIALPGGANRPGNTRLGGCVFPLTPERVPFFPDPASFADWMDEQLELGTMQNGRHLWLGIRPNGPATPRVLDRLELRICDRISDPVVLQAVTALYEAPRVAGAGAAGTRSAARPIVGRTGGARRRQRARRRYREPRSGGHELGRRQHPQVSRLDRIDARERPERRPGATASAPCSIRSRESSRTVIRRCSGCVGWNRGRHRSRSSRRRSLNWPRWTASSTRAVRSWPDPRSVRQLRVSAAVEEQRLGVAHLLASHHVTDHDDVVAALESLREPALEVGERILDQGFVQRADSVVDTQQGALRGCGRSGEQVEMSSWSDARTLMPNASASSIC